MLCPREHPPPLALGSCRGTWVLCSVRSGGCRRLELGAFEVFTNLGGGDSVISTVKILAKPKLD